MIQLVQALALGMAAFGASVSGVVLDEGGAPLPGISVFAEPGLGGKLLHVETGEGGRFEFDTLPAGATGVFVAEPGRAFVGQHLNLSPGDARSGLRLQLSAPESVAGQIKSAEGEPLKGAQITRVALTANSKVGIPLSKLTAHGFSVPTSDATGRFEVPGLPRGETVALKAGHGSYAQEGVQDVRVGDQNVAISLYRGVLVEGTVVERGTQVPASNVAILLRNAQPPHDTAVAETNASGSFTVRLKPGVYLCGATGAGVQSAGWEQFRVTGEESRQIVRLSVAGAGMVTGRFMDAVTAKPIAGVRVSLYSSGARAAVQRTGPGGEYQFQATEGANAVRIESAPGYLPPPTPELPFSVKAGERVELPEMWLAPMPLVSLDILSENGQPAAGAVVRLMRPAQFGWQMADASGRLKLQLGSFPVGEKVLGFVESSPGSGASEVAVFALPPDGASTSSVQLFRAARLRGQVVGDSGKPLEGVEVGGLFPGETEQAAPLLLWRLRTDSKGGFDWPAIAPGIPQQVVLKDASGAVGSAPLLNLSPGETYDMGAITLQGGRASVATVLEWSGRNFEVQCGETPDWRGMKRRALCVVFTGATDADAVGESLDAASVQLSQLGVLPLVVTDQAITCGGSNSTVLRTSSLGRPRTLLQRNDGATIELDGLPPFAVLKELTADAN